MEAALVGGVDFIQEARGYWRPNAGVRDNVESANQILHRVAYALGFSTVGSYLRHSGLDKDDIRKRIATCYEEALQYQNRKHS